MRIEHDREQETAIKPQFLLSLSILVEEHSQSIPKFAQWRQTKAEWLPRKCHMHRRESMKVPLGKLHPSKPSRSNKYSESIAIRSLGSITRRYNERITFLGFSTLDTNDLPWRDAHTYQSHLVFKRIDVHAFFAANRKKPRANTLVDFRN